MIDEDKVTGIVGFSFTTVALAGAPVAQDAGVPTIAVGVSAAEVTQVGNAIFRLFPLYPGMLSRVGPDLISQLKPKSGAIILQKDSSASVPQHDAWKDMLTKAGAKLAADVEVVSTDTDYSAQMAQVKAANPDVVFLTVAAGLEANVENQLRQAGYKGQIVGGLSHGSDAVLSVIGPNGKGDLWIDPYFAGSDTANNQKFVDEFKAANGGKNPDLFNAVGYEGVKLMLAAVKQAGSMDRGPVLKALQSMKGYDGVFGSCTFDNERNLTCPGNILKLQDVGSIVKAQ
jgi:branched-chain amino acid transport system substrate-binding protein